MKKFILLYLGPYGDTPNQQLVTQAAVDAWAQQLGAAVADKGALFFGGNRQSVLDRGEVVQGRLPVHGYAIIEAEDINAACAAIQGHPFLQIGNEANYEIEVLEFLDENAPPPTATVAADASTAVDTQTPDPMISAQQPPSAVVQPDNFGELNVTHDRPENSDQSSDNRPGPQSV